MNIENRTQLEAAVTKHLEAAPITDVHTHIYAEDFGELLLWGIDELLVYHYLVAEYFRYSTVGYEEFFAYPKTKQADLIWKTLFIDRSPVSEAQRGVLTVLQKLGLDVRQRNLDSYRKYFSNLKTADYLNIVFDLSKVQKVVMTNDPFDPVEKKVWDNGGFKDPRFFAVLRIDPLLNTYEKGRAELNRQGYKAGPDLDAATESEIKRFLKDWALRMKALYMAVSLPPDFVISDGSMRAQLIRKCVMPVCKELNLPFAPMIGVKKLINPELRLAGDSVAPATMAGLEDLLREFPGQKLLVTMLSRENQHSLVVLARKFRNLKVFGCWWFLNNPSLIEEMTRMRMEMLGFSFIPQHSDARVLDQLVYKWDHSRRIIRKVLVDKYADTMATGWTLSEDEIARDVKYWVTDQFWDFLQN